MELAKTVSRDLYIDVTLKENELSEIYLYLVDLKADKSFRTSEFEYSLPDDFPEDEEKPDLKMMFFEKFLELKTEGIKTSYFAIDAGEVMLSLIEPLKNADGKAKRAFNGIAESSAPGEWLTDCLSMGRVVAMTSFDERPELGANIRRRLKEKYHNVATEVKKTRDLHIFVRYDRPVKGPELSFKITDAAVNVIDDIRLHGRIDDDIMVAKTCELIAKYPEADIIADKTSAELYTLVNTAKRLSGDENKALVFSINSMLYALGKNNVTPSTDSYRDYVLNAEALRFGRYEDNTVVGVHYLMLPLRYNSEKAWKSNFKKNSLWKKSDVCENEYVLIGEHKSKSKKKKENDGEIIGRLSVEKGNEKFVLKCSSVSVKKYIPGFAVLTMGIENHFYPGKHDVARINELCSSLWGSSKADDSFPDVMNLQLKGDTKTYSLDTVKRNTAGVEPWLGLLLTMGRKKANRGGKYFLTKTLSERSYAYFDDGTAGENEESRDAIRTALIRSEYLLNIEKELAETVGIKGRPGYVPMNKSRKKTVKHLNGAFNYMLTSYTYDVEHGEYKENFCNAYKQRKGKETEERLEKKFDLLYE
ncbi:MAG: hypothetical protein MJ124_01305 [Lachnospiraceae bacterium]|nr:hypothetical protein [Lachnospiraceae bacterium]